MKKQLLATAAMTLTTTVVIAATAVGFEPIFFSNSGTVLLIDRATIKPVSQSFADRAKSLIGGPKANRQVWELINTDSPSDPFRSAKVLQEVNCNTRQTNMVSFMSYSKLNGDGELIYSSNPAPDWQYTAPGTGGDALVTAVCK